MTAGEGHVGHPHRLTATSSARRRRARPEARSCPARPGRSSRARRTELCRLAGHRRAVHGPRRRGQAPIVPSGTLPNFTQVLGYTGGIGLGGITITNTDVTTNPATMRALLLDGPQRAHLHERHLLDGNAVSVPERGLLGQRRRDRLPGRPARRQGPGRHDVQLHERRQRHRPQAGGSGYTTPPTVTIAPPGGGAGQSRR